MNEKPRIYGTASVFSRTLGKKVTIFLTQGIQYSGVVTWFTQGDLYLSSDIEDVIVPYHSIKLIKLDKNK